MWDPVEGVLEMVEPEKLRLADFRDVPLLIAERSISGDVTAELVDARGQPADLAGKIVLVRDEPAKAWSTLGKQGPAGILSAAFASYFGRSTLEEAVVWAKAPKGVLAMMISPRQGERLAAWLRRAQTVKVRMRAVVRQTEPGAIGMVMGEVRGTVEGEDVVLVAHLDHHQPGANDNASGSGTLLEVLRTLKNLVQSRKIPAPRRTIRFWWSTEIASEEAYFRAHPDEARKILMAVNLDQAGGERGVENHFVAIYGPEWLPSFADDLIYNLGEQVKAGYAQPLHQPSSLLVAPDGSDQSFHPLYWDYAPLSDHVAFESREVGIPAISLAVPSLRLIHSSLDTVARLDPTWMKRSALMTLAPALYLANAGPTEARQLLEYVFSRSVKRLAQARDVKGQVAREERRLDSVQALDRSLNTEPLKKRLRIIAETMAAGVP
jgi:hypothetical protein